MPGLLSVLRVRTETYFFMSLRVYHYALWKGKFVFHSVHIIHPMFFWKGKFVLHSVHIVHSFCQYQSSVSDVGAKCWASKFFQWTNEKKYFTCPVDKWKVF